MRFKVFCFIIGADPVEVSISGLVTKQQWPPETAGRVRHAPPLFPCLYHFLLFQQRAFCSTLFCPSTLQFPAPSLPLKWRRVATLTTTSYFWGSLKSLSDGKEIKRQGKRQGNFVSLHNCGGPLGHHVYWRAGQLVVWQNLLLMLPS